MEWEEYYRSVKFGLFASWNGTVHILPCDNRLCKSRAYSNIGTRYSARVCFLRALKQCTWDHMGPKWSQKCSNTRETCTVYIPPIPLWATQYLYTIRNTFCRCYERLRRSKCKHIQLPRDMPFLHQSFYAFLHRGTNHHIAADTRFG